MLRPGVTPLASPAPWQGNVTDMLQLRSPEGAVIAAVGTSLLIVPHADTRSARPVAGFERLLLVGGL